ncbi:MAG: hypothetical protein A2901_00680 [Elusimicrobia bacterium RIFCSPLOWO2_01_FULL_54_10]|nr:MAG: hypothetical protein A2901_00680 [Elusimicrobia bacterium RIFCSPLOWO2_01_FULL_54_10]
MNLGALLTDIYFWAALVFFALSTAGIFWIMKSLQNETREESSEMPEIPEMPPPARAPAPTVEMLAQQISQIDETLSKIEKKLSEQNADQMNEMAGQMKLIVQMLKTVHSATGGDAQNSVQQRVDKIYQILSTLSQSEPK